jgi:hypothetical protein
MQTEQQGCLRNCLHQLQKAPKVNQRKESKFALEVKK